MSRSAVGVLVVLAIGFVAVPAHAEVERFAVVIGNDRGARTEAELRYAQHDAAKVAGVFESVGGVAAENVVLLRGKRADDVRKSLIAVNDRIRTRRRDGRQTVLLVYYSGHADAGSLHLDGSELPVDQLEQLVRGSSADVRLLILDSCRSGTLTRVKGGRAARALVLDLDDRLAGEGVIFLTASTGSEDAQESDEIKGSFFTHYLVSGLLGAADADGDGQVALKEVYRHAYDQTVLASSRTAAGIQHPTFRYELSGQRDLVLSQLKSQRGRALLQLPAGRIYVVARDDGPRAVVAEVGALGTARTLSLEPGRYLVRVRARDHMLEGKIRLAAGATVALDDRGFTRLEYARLVRKGGGERDAVHGFALGLTVRSATQRGASPCVGTALAYPIERRQLTLAPRLSFCRGGFSNDFLSAHTDALGFGVRATHAWDLPGVTLDTGIFVGGELLRESFYDTAASAPTRIGVGGVLGVTLGALRDLSGGYYIAIDLTVQAHILRVRQLPADEDMPEPSTLESRFALSGATWLGRRF